MQQKQTSTEQLKESAALGKIKEQTNKQTNKQTFLFVC